MTFEELQMARKFGHLEVVAHRLKERYGDLPFYAQAQTIEGFDLWRRKAASAWNLDGLADEVALLRTDGRL